MIFLQLNSSIPFGETVYPVTLPLQGGEFPEWSDALLAGWGLPYVRYYTQVLITLLINILLYIKVWRHANVFFVNNNLIQFLFILTTSGYK